MPLQPGKSNKAVGQNIKTLEAEGRPPKQAIAISLKKAGRAKMKPSKKGK